MARPGKKCEFTFCNANKRDNPERTFFTFPVRRPDICDQWVINCANERISDLPCTQLQYRAVCNRHFTRDSFTSDMKNRLEPHAIPTLIDSASQNDGPSLPALPQPTPPPPTATQSTATPPTDAPITTLPPLLLEATSSPPPSQLSPTILPPQTMTYLISGVAPHPAPVSSPLSDPMVITSIALDKSTTPVKSKLQSLSQKFGKRSDALDLNNDTPRKVKLRRRIKMLKSVQHKHRMKMSRLKSKHSKLTTEEIFKLACRHIKSEDFKTMLRMQMLHKKYSPWTESEKQLSLGMYYKSPSLYTDLRNNKNVALPSRSVIKNWLQVDNLQPGICEEVLEKLKIKAREMTPQDRQVVLMFDEMSIKKCLQYNEKRDIIEGYQDLGDLGRSSDLATHATLFLVRGLMSKWKMPVAYFITHDLKGEDLAKLLMQVVDALLDVNLEIRAVVCDQGTNNRKAVNILKVKPDHPFININNKKIYILFDAPHLVKSIRNILIKSDIDVAGGTAKWEHIEKLYELDEKSSKARALVKLTPKHIRPNSFDKMKVKLATQVFSNSVRAAMVTAIATSELPVAAEHTATFVGHMNDVFDCLNSRVQFDANPLRCAVSSSPSGQHVIHTMEAKMNWIKNWRRRRTKKNQRVTPSCFSGLVWTINSILQLWKDLREEGFQFLLTSRLSQDILENEFSIQRQRAGYDKNPSAMRFRQNLRFRMLRVLLRPPETSNCEVDEDLLGLPTDIEHVEEDTDPEVEDHPKEAVGDDKNPQKDSDDKGGYDTDDGEMADHPYFQPPGDDVEMTSLSADKPVGNVSATLESCSTQYVAGYLASKLMKKYRCDNCRSDLTVEEMLLDDEDELLILNRSFATTEGVSHLYAPSPLLAKVTDTTLAVFVRTFDRVKTLSGVKAAIVDLTRAEISMTVPEWFETNDKCTSHREFLINACLKMKIIKHILWESQRFKVPKSHTSSHQKLKKLQNM